MCEDALMEIQGDIIDEQRLNELRSLDGGSVSFAIDLVEDFKSQIEETFSTLDRSLEKGDVKTIWQLAHKLKSSTTNIAAKRLAVTCVELESLCKAHAPLDELRSAVDRFKRDVAQFTEAFQSIQT